MYGGLIFLKVTGARFCKGATVLVMSIFLFFVGLESLKASETRQHGAHVHGVGQLNVALDENDLMFELTSPAANFVGFEHAPENEQQSHEVHRAIELLKEGKTLFVFTKKAQCNLHEAHVDSDMVQSHHEEHEAHHQDPEHAHPGKDHDEDSVHSDFVAVYHFECNNPDSLKSIDVQLFTHFPGLEELEVQLLTPKVQTAVELTPKKSQISL